jgi:hypothetical protein
MRLLPSAILAFAVAAKLAGAAAEGEVAQPSALALEMQLLGTGGTPLQALKPESFVTLRLLVKDVSSQVPVANLALEAWVRPVEDTNLKCNEAARAFRATRRLPNNAIDLNGMMLVTLNEDGSFSVSDPKLDLATANMIAAGKLTGRPDFVVVDPSSQSIIAIDKRRKSIVQIGLSGTVRKLQDNAEDIVAVAPMSDNHLLTLIAGGHQLSLIDANGSQVATRVFDQPLRGMSFSGQHGVLLWGDKEAMLANARDLSTRKALAVLGNIRDALTLPGKHGEESFALLDEQGKSISVVFESQMPVITQHALPVVAQHLAYAESQNMLIAWSDTGAAAIYDVARGEMAGAFAVHGGISSVTSTEKAAFFMSTDASSVFVLELASVKPGQSPQLHEVRLGQRSNKKQTGRNLLQPLLPSPQVLALHPETNTAFIVDERSAVGDSPPMSAVSLRGGQVFAVFAIDRSLREVKPGTFETQVKLPSPGDYELVVTTGISGLTRCIPISVQGDRRKDTASKETEKSRLLIAGAPFKMRSTSIVDFKVLSPDGAPLILSDASVQLSSLEFGWSPEIKLTTTPNGTFRFNVDFPVPGLYGLRIESQDISPSGSVQELIEVMP